MNPIEQIRALLIELTKTIQCGSEFERIKDAIALLDQLPQWQPIESVPLNIDVLVWCKTSGAYVAMARASVPFDYDYWMPITPPTEESLP